ncbi:LacI family DNA-binding transcriptional regulator [Isoptericola chiayiensis]|uniref:LacI family DNA-binding transcriptional regulator n=1 Tax=Isoptericola chiayiensis TaxID=579446 RepID=A0ABP8YJX3_9MICO|nr:LacI family DNA-binding transcriptional regulator [Isoptericola chiayiensis]NOV99678.1 DNA-binding LacI/PurR family transcriptional regulator [Isoptericola chiayiensis]
MPVTSADVARAAGVSRATVSYVLNDTPGSSISTATKEHVRATAARLGYAPSAAARALRRGRSDLVVCVLPDWPTGPVVDTVLDLLSDNLAARGLFLLVHHHRSTRPLRELWKAVTPRVVVGLTHFPAEDLRALRQAGIEVVGAGDVDDGGHPGLDPDNQRGLGALQVEHLLDRGHRRIGIATTPEERLREFASLRVDGIRAACAAAGVSEPPVAVVDPTVPATDLARGWGDDGVDAVACYNDEVALAVLAGAREARLDVPGDLAVIGLDDAPAAALADPPLTSVAQPSAAQAHHLAACVEAVLDGTPQPDPPTEPSRVVVRAST